MTITDKSMEDFKKCVELIGKQIYVISNVYDGRPFVKAVKITSVEFYGSSYWTQLKTAHNGSYRYGHGYFDTREEAEQAIERQYAGVKTKNEPLKYCPVCKGPALISQYAQKYQIECANCGLATAPVAKLADAIRKWNDRVE